ncbi:hypothetical protein FACS1894187_14260 [Synergistales bacterium]|nr:hypothetical protein FACS1894187_14260 [Synergistales bacterium]
MLIFKGDKLLISDETYDFNDLGRDGGRCLRSSKDLPASWDITTHWREVGDADGDGIASRLCAAWEDLRVVWTRFGEEDFVKAGAAFQYMNWLRLTRFCSVCGGAMSPREEDKGLLCGSCGRVVYAPLHPAIIVAVERDGKLLLAHNARMPTKRYSVLAGFVEPGESLEQTIAREVMEEVGVEVQDVRYFGSQPWPFPCSLMLGFTARWKSGEIHPDGLELNDAGWYAPEDFPEIPPGMSISRKLIDDFAVRMGKR